MKNINNQANTKSNTKMSLILISKFKSSKLPSTCKILHSKISRKSWSSHLKPQRKKSLNFLKTSKKTENCTTSKKEIKTSISIWEWSHKAWLKFNKSEWVSNNKSWWKSVSQNNTLPNININLAPSFNSKWCLKVWALNQTKSLPWPK